MKCKWSLRKPYSWQYYCHTFLQKAPKSDHKSIRLFTYNLRCIIP